ncbi:Outer membrane efflux protein [Candidatus Methylobacter favarea]|uniref:Outer membrane efflux protein n=1 Tax=Candidatus Methylobacter favarea TaxID=2707345 RepID=A0A8S0YA48_9GAMM|nr:TolC family protein [Candidatus Methylobacter favarea]CAA9891091.1 Outer membrane efflux protein [Candidatus Methylobacter favarea]
MVKTIKNSLALSLVPLSMLFNMSAMADPVPKNSADNAVPEKLSGQFFSLDQAIDYALANNPDLQIATERISQAEAQLGIALSAFYPQLTARVGYQHSNNPAEVFGMIVAQRDFDSNSINNINNPGYRQNFRPEIIGKLSLFRGGQDYQNSKAAELGVDAAEFERSTVRNALIEAVTATYYAYLASIEAHKVAQSSISAIASELKQTQRRYEAGTVLKSDVLSLEVQLAEAQSAEIRAANAIEIAKTSIAKLLGLSSFQAFTVASSSSLLPKPKLPASFNDLLDQAMAQRPEVKAAARRVDISVRQLKSERGAYLPKADAYVSYGQNSQSPGFNSEKDNVTAGVSVEMDLFSGFNTQQRVRAAERKAAEARETERKTKLAIEQEVKTAFLNLKEALARLHVAETSVLAADEALRLVNEERRAEMVTVTRYIESEVARNKARSSTIAAHYDALSAEAALKKAIGDWK